MWREQGMHDMGTEPGRSTEKEYQMNAAPVNDWNAMAEGGACNPGAAEVVPSTHG